MVGTIVEGQNFYISMLILHIDFGLDYSKKSLSIVYKGT